MEAFGLALALCLIASCSADLPGKSRTDGKIVGGTETTIEDLPHMLSLMEFGTHSCGASIISEDWALTAAHCVTGAPPDTIQLRAGSNERNIGGTVHPVSQIIIHNSYNGGTDDYDIAVLKVEVKFKFGPKVQKIALRPAGSPAPTGTNVLVSGWGKTSSGGAMSNKLRKVTVKVVDHKKCVENYKFVKAVTARMMCAGVSEGGKDACQNDSGGPLIINSPRVQVGIVSWGEGCAEAKYPGVYTDVSVLRQWIKDKTGI